MRKLTPIAARLLAAVAAVAAVAAQADVAEIHWDAGGRYEKSVVVPPGKLVELCGKLDKGAKVTWSFKSEAPMNFNIHYHEGENVSYPVKQAGVTAAEGSLDVSQPQDYCWMWSNKGTAAVPLKAVLQRRAG